MTSSPPLSISQASSSANSGLDLIIAQHLAEILQGSITTNHSAAQRQFYSTVTQKIIPALDAFLIILNLSRQQKASNNLTILCLYPELDAIDPETNHDSGLKFLIFKKLVNRSPACS